ncbi:MAG: 2-C-methyl-D-erythritol 4-phosphate cytidylyltransferase [Planctomycetota bacterium]|nr:MAG: 2-C-methyl-D-erythritol 4-phosphate cytidylyltransferase [Planctomycetota bacterium]
MKDVAVILAAAGRSTRFNDPYQKKVYASVHGKPVWQYSAQLFADHPRVGQIIMTIAMEDQEMVQEKFAGNLTLFGVEVVLGGEERSESVRNALQRIRPGIALVAIHDAARPCLSRQSLNQVIEEASKHRAAILASPIRATVKRVDPTNHQIIETVPRDGLWQAQTPQVFRTEDLQRGYANAKGNPTDDAQVIEKMGIAIRVVEGHESNIKITTKEDLRTVEGILKSPARTRDNPFF